MAQASSKAFNLSLKGFTTCRRCMWERSVELVVYVCILDVQGSQQLRSCIDCSSASSLVNTSSICLHASLARSRLALPGSRASAVLGLSAVRWNPGLITGPRWRRLQCPLDVASCGAWMLRPCVGQVRTDIDPNQEVAANMIISQGHRASLRLPSCVDPALWRLSRRRADLASGNSIQHAVLWFSYSVEINNLDHKKWYVEHKLHGMCVASNSGLIFCFKFAQSRTATPIPTRVRRTTRTSRTKKKQLFCLHTLLWLTIVERCFACLPTPSFQQYI